MSSLKTRAAATAVAVVRPAVIEPLNAAAARAVADMHAARGPAGGSPVAAFESLEGRVMMAGQPAASDSSMAYDAAGNLHVAYYDAAAKRLTYTKQSAAGEWSAPAVIDATSADVGRTPSLAVAPGNHPGVAYYDAANADLRYAYHDGTTWKTVRVDSKGGVGKNPSLAFDAKGVASISYYRQDSGDLRLATLKSLAKNKWTIATVAKKGDVGEFSSVAIDPATNKPGVVFTDADGKIQYVGKKGAKPVVIDDLPAGGSNLDVAFGPNGKPTISYYDPSSGTVKVAEPADPKAKSFAAQVVADVPAGSNAAPSLVIDPATGDVQVVFYDAEADGVFVARKPAGGAAGSVQTEQLKAGGGDGFIAAVQPGNGSISFAVVDTSGAGGAPVDLGNTETTPLPPTDLAAAATGDTTATVTWADAADNETGYVVERSTDGAAFAEVAQLAAGSTSFADTGLAEATSYYYRVGATGGSGEVSYATAGGAVALGIATTRPHAPTGLTASNATAGQIALAWASDSAAASGYRVERASAADANDWTLVELVGPGARAYSDTTAAEGTGYAYRVLAVLGGNASAASNVASAVAKPAAPDEVTVTRVSTTRLDVSWSNNSAHATAVVLERSSNGTTFAPLATLAADEATYGDTSVTEGHAYYYRARAVVGAVAGDYSAVANGSTAANAPSNLAATAVSPTRIDLTWTDNSAAETGYVVQRAVTGGQFLTVATVDANATSYADANRSEGVSYTYRVRANGAADSSYSGTATATPLPSAPSALAAALAAGGTQVALTWADNAAAETGYVVQRQANGSPDWTTLATTAANATGYTDATAAEGTTYAYRVRAASAAGASAFSGTATATTVPAAASNLVVTTTSTTALALSWADNSAGETGYAIARSTDGGATFAPLTTLPAGSTSYNDTGLTAGSAYYYKMTATNGGGASAATAAVAGTTLSLAPTNVAAAANSATSVTVTWTAAAGATHYAVERSADGGTTWSPAGQADLATFTDATVSEASGYSYRVSAINAGGTGAASAAAAVTTPPATPTDLVADATGATSVHLTWTDHSAGETGYQVERSTDGKNFVSIATPAANAGAYDDTTAAEATTYTYRVRATGAGGASAYGNTAFDTTVPAAPPSLSAVEASGQVNLTWTDGSAGETGYVVERTADAGATWNNLASPAAGTLAYADTNVAPGGTYAYRVRAVGTGGASANSTVASLTVKPTAPTNLAAAALDDDSVSLSWTAAAGVGTYSVERSGDGGTTFTVVHTTADATGVTFTNTGLSESTSYVYRVFATNAGGNGPASSPSTVRTPPTAASGLGLSHTVHGQVDLTWTSASATGNVRVMRSLAGADFAQVADLAPGTHTYSDTTVLGGREYAYKLVVNDGTLSAAADSNTATVTTVPDAVGSLAAASSTATTIDVTWAASVGATGYTVERSADGGTTYGSPVTVATNSYADSALTEGTAYTYRVTPSNGSGNGPAATAGTSTLPAAATALTVTAHTATSVSLAWTDNSNGESGYVVERSVNGTAWGTLTTTAANATSYTDATAAEATAYLYRVTPAGAGGSGTAVTVDAITRPAAATGVAATAHADGSVTVAWTDASNGETGYKVFRSTDGGTTWGAVGGTLAAGTATYADTAAPAGTALKYKVVAVGLGGDAADSNVADALTVPAAVTDLSATAAGTSTVNLAWTDVAGNASYTLERQEGIGAFAVIDAAVGANANTYSDTTALEGRAYTYRLTAVNTMGSGPASNLPTATTLPAAPSGLAATAISATQVDLAWTGNSASATAYTVSRSTDGGTTWSVLSAGISAGTTTLADTSATAGSTYSYKVVAIGPGGTSADSNVATALTMPAAVTDLAATAAGTSTVNLTWTDVSSNTGYSLERQEGAGAFAVINGALGANANSYADTGVTEGKTYTYRLTATNASGSGAASNLPSASTAPAAPSGLSATAFSAARVDLAWTGNSPTAASYTVYRSADAGTTWSVLSAGIAAGTLTLQDTTPAAGTAYSYKVVAVGPGGASADSNVVAATTMPAAVADLAATGAGTTTVNLTWTDVAGNTGYSLERREGAGAFAVINGALGANAASYSDTGVTEGKTYTYRLTAANASGSGAASNTPTASTAPAAPSALTATPTSATNVNLAWTENSAGETSVTVQRLDAGTWTTIATLSANAASHADTVAAGGTYQYRVFATGAGGDSAASGTATATTVPPAPASFTATPDGTPQVTVAWAAANGATGYRVFRSDNNGTTFAQLGADLPGNAVSYADAAVTEATAYQYKVVAFNATGAGAATTVVPVTTLPAAPTSLGVSAVSTTTVTLAWTDNSGGETAMKVYKSTDGGTTFNLAATLAANTTTWGDTSISPNATYAYKVTAVNGAAESAATNTVSALTRPAAPTGLTVTVASATALTVSWTAADGATGGYKVYRDAGDGNGFVLHQTVGAGVTALADGGLSEAHAYAYKVAAVNASGEGVATASAVSATTNPAAPDTVSSMSVLTTGLTVTWVDHSAGEDGFEVQRSADGGTTWTDVGTAAAIGGTGGGGIRADSGLTEATGYSYRVRATLGAQRSVWSGAHALDTDPVAPASLSVTDFTNAAVTLAWADSSAGEDGYEVDRSADGGTTWSTIATRPAGSTGYVDGSRAQSTAYSYRVRATRGSSASTYSPTATVTTRPAAPTALVATPTAAAAVSLTWTDNASAEDGYVVERSTDGGTTWSSIHDSGAAGTTSYTDSAAPESATTKYRVHAYKGLVASADSNVATATTPVAAPSGVVAAATSHSAVHVTWTDNSGVETAQRVERSADGGTSWTVVATVGAFVAQYDDTGLTEDTAYDYQVIALKGLAESAAGAASTVTTPLAPPTALAATAPTATSVALTWTNASAAATNVVIERFAAGSWSTLTTVAGNVATYTDSTVAEGTAYQYRLHATKSGNASATTAAASVTTPPAAPTGFGTTVISAGQIDLAWTDVSGHEANYKVERSENGGAYSVIATLAADAATYSDLAAHEGGTFAYLVYAVGTGGSSTTIAGSVTTAPAAPTALGATVVSATRVDLAWTDNSGGETAYTVERSAAGANTWSTLASLAPSVATYSDTAALEAHAYDYRVRASRNAAHSSWATASATTIPATPTALAAAVVATGSPRVNLSWADNSAGETGYELQRSADAGTSWSAVTSAAANATAYSDNSVAEGTSYQYRVRATSAAGASEWSTVASAATRPTPPTGLTATAVSSTQVNLAWTDASTHETGYKVERSSDGGSTFSVVAASLAAGTTTYADTTALEGVTYQYRVSAFTAAAAGEPSSTATAGTPLAAPTALAASAVTTTTVALTWADNSTVENSYKVERSTDGGTTWSVIATTAANATTYTDTGRTAGTAYHYQVRAFKAGLYSAYTAVLPVTTIPSNPAGLTATAASDTTVNLAWTDATGETAYTVERSADAGVTWSVLSAVVAANATTYADGTAAENTAYVYRVKATNAAGASGYATSGTATTLPAAPTGASATATASDTIELTWTDVSAAETGYKVERRVGAGAWGEVATLAANAVSYIDTTLDESVTYEFRVRATVGGRNSAYSNAAQATTLSEAPSALAVAAVTPTTVQLTWTNTSAAPMVVVERSANGGASYSAVGSTGQGGVGVTDTGLTEGVTYVYRVRTYNGDGGFSGYSNTAVAVTTPTAVASLAADVSTPAQVALTWTDASGTELGYAVERSVHGANSWSTVASLAAGSTGYTNTGLTTADDFDYRVRGFNAGGNTYSATVRAIVG